MYLYPTSLYNEVSVILVGIFDQVKLLETQYCESKISKDFCAEKWKTEQLNFKDEYLIHLKITFNG